VTVDFGGFLPELLGLRQSDPGEAWTPLGQSPATTFPALNHARLPESSLPVNHILNKLQVGNTRPMKRSSAGFLFVLFCTMAATSTPSFAQQQDEPESNRKVVNRVMPAYPYLAYGIRLKGTVKVNVVVGPNGKAKTIEAKGGHPVLVQAAEDAIKKWKWEPSAHETQELIEVNFNPEH
jgi:TonB family protein